MKRRVLFFLSITLLWAGYVFADVPDQVVMHYTGDIVVNPCTVASNAIYVDFGDIDAAGFTEIDSASAERNASIKFSGCDKDTTIDVSVTPDGPPLYTTVTPAHPCGLFSSQEMANSTNWPAVGVEAIAIVGNEKIDLACKPNLSIYPTQRSTSDMTSYNLNMVFRLIKCSNNIDGMKNTVKNSMAIYIVVSYR